MDVHVYVYVRSSLSYSCLSLFPFLLPLLIFCFHSSFLTSFSVPILPSSPHFLFPFLLSHLIFCSHPAFLSSFFCSHSYSSRHTHILQSISVSCTSWSYSVIMLWTQPVFCCMHYSHRVRLGMCPLDSTVRWIWVWNVMPTVSMFAGKLYLLLLCTCVLIAAYPICSIRRRGYYLFHLLILCGSVREWQLVKSSIYFAHSISSLTYVEESKVT